MGFIVFDNHMSSGNGGPTDKKTPPVQTSGIFRWKNVSERKAIWKNSTEEILFSQIMGELLIMIFQLCFNIILLYEINIKGVQSDSHKMYVWILEKKYRSYLPTE